MSTAVPPPLRSNPPVLPLGEHVRNLSWSRDGRHVAAALGSGEMVIVDTDSNAVARRWSAHGFGVLRAVWSPDGMLIASGGEDRLLRWWDPADARCVHEEKHKAWVEHLDWAPAGTMLASASARELRLWSAPGACAATMASHESTISAIRWRGDGKGIGSACFGRVQLFRLGEEKPYENLALKTSHVSLAWSPNGRHVAAGSQENTVTYWKLPFREREPLQMSGYPAKVKVLEWDRESRFLATGGGEILTVWDVSGRGPAGSKPLRLEGHPGKLGALAFQRNGDALASGCVGGEVWLWCPVRGSSGMKAATLPAEITALAWSPDEKRLAVAAADGSFQLVW